MSVEIFKRTFDHNDAVRIKNNVEFGLHRKEAYMTSSVGSYLLTKQEVAQLIAALQAMHDKMGE